MISHISYECNYCGARASFDFETFNALAKCPVCKIPFDREPTPAELERAQKIAKDYKAFMEQAQQELEKAFGDVGENPFCT